MQSFQHKGRAFKRDLLNHMQLTHLRTVTGCIRSRERLVLGKRAESMLCPFCQDGSETVTHILRQCKNWDMHRNALLTKYPRAVLESLPECNKRCGTVRNAISFCDKRSFAHDLQKCFVAILNAREAEHKVKGREWLDMRTSRSCE